MSAPKWNTGDNKLYLKGLRVDNNLAYTGCSSSYKEAFASGCASSSGFGQTTVTATSYDPIAKLIKKNYGTISAVFTNLSRNNGNYALVTSVECQDAGGPYYKSTSMAEMEAAITKTTIHPNPAHDEIFISLSAEMRSSADIKIELMNLLGQSVYIFYSGHADQLKPTTRLQLPDVVTGIYVVRVFANGKEQFFTKLSVIQ